MVIFQLIDAYCKPLLTYTCECVKFNRNDLSQLNRAWNSIFWKVFNPLTVAIRRYVYKFFVTLYH